MPNRSVRPPLPSQASPTRRHAAIRSKPGAAVVLTLLVSVFVIAPDIATARGRDESAARSRDSEVRRDDHPTRSQPSRRAFSIGFDGNRRFPVEQGDVVAVGEWNPSSGTCVFNRPVGVLTFDSGSGDTKVRLQLSDECSLVVASISHSGKPPESPADPGPDISPTVASQIPTGQSTCFHLTDHQRHMRAHDGGHSHKHDGSIFIEPSSPAGQSSRSTRPLCRDRHGEHGKGH